MKIILAYKDFHRFNPNISHIGLGVAAMNTKEVLRKHGVHCDDWPIKDSNELRQKLREHASDKKKHRITHVVISAPWILTVHMRTLCKTFPHIQFVMNCHSNVAFLQADPNGTRLLREALHLSLECDNFNVSANSIKMVKWIESAYLIRTLFLPNLYNLPEHLLKVKPLECTLNVGVFGAIRPQKNIVSAVGAAIVLSNKVSRPVEVYLSTGRMEGGGNTILNTVRALVAGLSNVTLVESSWTSWPQFRKLVRSMNLLITPSYTESFNMVTADGIAEGVPSVVGEAISWAPSNWKANVDDVCKIANRAEFILKEGEPVFHEGVLSLKKFIADGIAHWTALDNLP